MLTGNPPFLGRSTLETVRLVLETDPRQPWLLNPKVDRDLATICLKCLEKDPRRRYSSALALSKDLERWLRHEPIQARRTGFVSRGKKWLRRNPSYRPSLALPSRVWARNLFPAATNNNSGKQDLLRAADLLNQAVARDPSYFEAYCQLGGIHDALYLLAHDHSAHRLALAQDAINAALRLRPDAGEAHLAQATHLYSGYLNYDAALAELELARKSLPNDCGVFELVGLIQSRRGKPEEALREFQHAVELDPRNVYWLEQSRARIGFCAVIRKQERFTTACWPLNPTMFRQEYFALTSISPGKPIPARCIK